MDEFQLAVGIALALIATGIAALMYATPSMGPPERFMGVGVTEGFSTQREAKRILRTYRAIVLSVTILGVSAEVLAIVAAPAWFGQAVALMFGLLGGGGIGAYLWAYGATSEEVVRSGAGAALLADERHWKWGLIYFNPDDPAVDVPKRFGPGRTLNFARGITWLILGIPLGLALIIAIVTSASR